MDSSKIEVGDVFTHIATGRTEYTAVDVSSGRILDNIGDWNTASCCRLVRKADPYHSVTRPEPPAGYRLAKWGEESEEAMFYNQRLMEWVPWQGPLVNRNTTYEATGPRHCIYAIPLDRRSTESAEKLVETQDRGYTVEKVQPPLKSWQFREVPWVQPEPKTLADVPENTPCVAYHTEDLYVAQRVGVRVVYLKAGLVEGGQSAYEPKAWRFVRYLDPPPQKPLSLDDVPDGRVIECCGKHYWKSGGNWLRRLQNGEIDQSIPTDKFMVTNYIAEFREPV